MGQADACRTDVRPGPDRPAGRRPRPASLLDEPGDSRHQRPVPGRRRDQEHRRTAPRGRARGVGCDPSGAGHGRADPRRRPRWHHPGYRAGPAGLARLPLPDPRSRRDHQGGRCGGRRRHRAAPRGGRSGGGGAAVAPAEPGQRAGRGVSGPVSNPGRVDRTRRPGIRRRMHPPADRRTSRHRRQAGPAAAASPGERTRGWLP